MQRTELAGLQIHDTAIQLSMQGPSSALLFL